MHMKGKKGFFVIFAGAGVIALVAFVYLGYAARITSPYLCEFCHNTYYDYREYSFNAKAVAAPMPRGVLYGCAECHRSSFREFKNSDHSKTEKAERPGCPNCHEPHNVINAARYMFATSPLPFIGAKGISEDVMIGSRKWEANVKPDWDKRVRDHFLKTDGKACRDCHKEIDWDLEAHQISKKEKMTCIECHFNLVHAGSPWPEKEEKKEKLGI